MKKADRSLMLAGLLIGTGAIYFIISLVIAEAVYPGYSVANNTISDLGVGSSALIFNSSVIFLGALIILGSFFLQKGLRTELFPLLIFLTGIGAVGVGIFNENYGAIHLLFALITFLFAGLSAMYFGLTEKNIIKYPSLILGVIDIVSLVLFAVGINLGLGHGGIERLIVYPTLLWAVLFSGNLLNK